MYNLVVKALVPIGDEILFSEYDYCMNLGGLIFP
jgi:hypothetical protein